MKEDPGATAALRLLPDNPGRCNLLDYGIKCWEAGYAAAQPQWVSVKDRLPNYKEIVVVRVPTRMIPYSVAYLDNDIAAFGLIWRDDCDCIIETIGNVVDYWTLLPEPPKEGE